MKNHAVDNTSISVVIATHDRHPELRALLCDLGAQDVQPDEVIVVDSDQATDSRLVVKEASADGLPVRHLLAPNVLATKRNHGVLAAQGDLIVILDDDLRVGRGFLAAHSAAHAGRPKTIASGPITFPEDWVAASNYYRFKQGRHSANDADESLVPPHRFVAMNHSIRREAYLSIGGYDDDYQMYGGEDLDFGHRAKRHGMHLALAPGADAEHHEVRMTWTTYFNKVHKAAYYGLPLVLTKNPESVSIPTVQAIGGGPATDARTRLLRAALAVGSQRTSMRHLASAFERLDAHSRAFTPRAYMGATLMANRIGLIEQRKGAPYEPLI
ncbi:glycosyltransferase family 2 protein [Janibacter hoylei]